MTVDEAKKQVGVTTDEELAAHLGVIRQSVVYWRKCGRLPEQRKLQLEVERLKERARKSA